MKLAPAAAVLALACTFAWLAISSVRPTRRATPAPIEASSADVGASSGAAPLLVDGQTTQRESELAGSSAPEAVPHPPQDPAAQNSPRESVVVRGRVVVVDELGVSHEQLSGELELEKQGGDRLPVAVNEGSWTIEVAPRAKLRATTLVLGGRPAVIDRPVEPTRIPRRPLVVRAHFPPRICLHVVDATTREPLTHVAVAIAAGVGCDEHPGLDADRFELVQDSPSPAIVEPPARGWRIERTKCFVRAGGYAWESMLLDFTAGGERTIGLARGGALVVTIVGEVTARPGLLLLRRSGSGRLVTMASVRGREHFALEGLLPGEYVVSVESGGWSDHRNEIARAEARVVVGADVPISLVIGPSTVRDVPMAGELFVPRAWKDVQPRMQVAWQDSGYDRIHDILSLGEGMRVRESSSQPLDWSTSAPPGTYLLSVSSRASPEVILWCSRIDLASDGKNDVRIVVPPPASVIVKLSDAATGRPVTDRDVRIARRVLADPDERYEAPHEMIGTSGCFRFVAPRGEWALRTTGGRYVPAEHVARLGAGRNEIQLAIRRSCEIALSFRDLGTPVPVEEVWDLEPIGPGESVVADDPGRFHVDAPGVYRFEMPRIPGYEPVPPQVVEARIGELVEHVVQLVRTP